VIARREDVVVLKDVLLLACREVMFGRALSVEDSPVKSERGTSSLLRGLSSFVSK